MDYIEKLFKQYPFIYRIGGKYYAFGTGVCVECDCDSVLLENKYSDYESSIHKDLTVEDAWRIFHKLIFEADYMKDKNAYCTSTKEEFYNFHFSDDEMNELKMQIDRYIKYWEKYSFNTYLH